MINIKKLISILSGLVLTFAFVTTVSAAGISVGNDATLRANTDTYTNFIILDTNNPVNNNGYLFTFNYYASNLNHFRFLLVDVSNKVQWISEEITPVIVGVNTYMPVSLVSVQSGWNLGVYFVSTGTIPFDLTGLPAMWKPNNSGLPSVGDILVYEGAVAGWTNRVYSFGAVGDNLPTNKDQCKKDGWKIFGVFKNQGDCVSYVATGGKNPPALLPR